MEIILAIVLFPVRLIRKIGKLLSRPLGPIGDAFVWICIKVYRFFYYVGAGITFPFKGLSKMEEYEQKLKKEKQEAREKREKDRESELIKQQEENSAAFQEKIDDLEKDFLSQKEFVDTSGLDKHTIIDRQERIERSIAARRRELNNLTPEELAVKISNLEELIIEQREELEIQEIQLDVIAGSATLNAENTIAESATADVVKIEETEDGEPVEGEESEKIDPKDLDAILFADEEENISKGIGGAINLFLERIFSWIPNAFKEGKRKREEAREKKAQQDGNLDRQALILDLEGEDSEKEEKAVMWEYVCRSPEGKTVKGYFAAHSKLEVHSFLQTQNMIIYSIRTNKWIQAMYSSLNGNGAKLKRKDLIFFLTQLSTYIKSGIPLVEAMNILVRQFKNKNYQRMFRAMMYDLTMGEPFSKAMENQGNSFPPILINMVKSSELTGELPEALDDMCEYFTQVEAARKEMISALTYPSIVLAMAIGVSIFMMLYIVPQFVEMFEMMDDAEIPGITTFVMNASDFLQNNILWIIIITIVFIIIMVYLFRNVKIVRTGMQWLAMHIPVMGTIIIYNQVTMFSKTFSSLLSHNVFITDSMKVLKKITNNEIYKAMILETVVNLASGEKISAAFKDHWAFPIPAYEMIVTGEKTGQLAEMMAKVSSYYQDEHKNAVTRVKALMEPLIIVFLTVVVGGIVLAIILPMFSMYEGLT